MSLSSPAVNRAVPGSVSRLPRLYTCDGQDHWPELNWRGVPPDTAELALFVLGFEPVDGELFFNWAVAGLDPGLEGVDAGKLPRGAVVGSNGYGETGYSICPNGNETYVFSLYALPESLSPRKGFDPWTLRKEVLDVSSDGGVMAATYTRG
jgi:phosphatidylethanolamine-binding protein (PEBP) family uncharacterized protein